MVEEELKFVPVVFREVVPNEGGGIRTIMNPGEEWKAPDRDSELKRLEEIGRGVQLEFPPTDGIDGSQITNYKDGSELVFYDVKDVRKEVLYGPGSKTSKVLWIVRKRDVGAIPGSRPA
jgi:hypothetical protein